MHDCLLALYCYVCELCCTPLLCAYYTCTLCTSKCRAIRLPRQDLKLCARAQASCPPEFWFMQSLFASTTCRKKRILSGSQLKEASCARVYTKGQYYTKYMHRWWKKGTTMMFASEGGSCERCAHNTRTHNRKNRYAADISTTHSPTHHQHPSTSGAQSSRYTQNTHTHIWHPFWNIAEREMRGLITSSQAPKVLVEQYEIYNYIKRVGRQIIDTFPLQRRFRTADSH